LRIMGQNSAEALPVDLRSCAAYENGMNSAVSLKCPSLCVLTKPDKMTPVKFGRMLADALPDNRLHVLEDSGHMIPVERPNEVNLLLKSFFGEIA